MSRIVVRIDGFADKTKVIAQLRRITNLGVGELNRRLTQGEVIVEYCLFNNDHDEVAGRLRRLVGDLPAAGATLRLFELPPDQPFDVDNNVHLHEITAEILRNILEEAERERGKWEF